MFTQRTQRTRLANLQFTYREATQGQGGPSPPQVDSEPVVQRSSRQSITFPLQGHIRRHFLSESRKHRYVHKALWVEWHKMSSQLSFLFSAVHKDTFCYLTKGGTEFQVYQGHQTNDKPDTIITGVAVEACESASTDIKVPLHSRTY